MVEVAGGIPGEENRKAPPRTQKVHSNLGVFLRLYPHLAWAVNFAFGLLNFFHPECGVESCPSWGVKYGNEEQGTACLLIC